MDKKIMMRTGYKRPPKIVRRRQTKDTILISSTTPLDSFTKDLVEKVVQWLKDKFKDKETISQTQTVNVTVLGSNPPGNPSNINIVNVIINCPNAQNCKSANCEQNK